MSGKMKRISTGLSPQCKGQTKKREFAMQSSTSKQSILRLASMKRRTTNTSKDNSNRPSLPFLTNLPIYPTNDLLKTARVKKIHDKKTEDVHNELKIREQLHSLKKTKDWQKTNREIKDTLKKYAAIQQQINVNDFKEPKSSFKVVYRLQKYRKSWAPHEEFFKRNDKFYNIDKS